MAQWKILVADDDPDIRGMIQILLEDEDYEVLFAKNGREVIETVDKHSVDLILLDLMMPEMDGYEALNALRESGKLEKLKILVVSARDIPIYQEISKGLGAIEHIVKPFMPDALLEKIRLALEEGKSA